jgi:hypothetical protein
VSGADDREAQARPERAEAFRALDGALSRLPRIEPSPTFEARFRARLARESEAPRPRGSFLQLVWLGRPWLVPALGLVALVLLVSRGEPSLPEGDWRLLTDGEGFDVALAAEPELLAALDAVASRDDAEGGTEL